MSSQSIILASAFLALLLGGAWCEPAAVGRSQREAAPQRQPTGAAAGPSTQSGSKEDLIRSASENVLESTRRTRLLLGTSTRRPPPLKVSKPARSPSPSPSPAMAADFDVIVVGSGVSGLAAASQLLKKKPNLKLTVLEARDRIGGRTYSVPLQGASGALDLASSHTHQHQWQVHGHACMHAR